MGLGDELSRRAREAAERLKGLRRPRVIDVFERVDYIGPDDIVVSNYLRRRPSAVFNPGAALMGGEILIFPRVVFDYYWYSSSIGLIRYRVGAPKPLRAEILLWPKEAWEIRGVEDPRIYVEGDRLHILHTSVALEPGGIRPLQAYTVLNEALKPVKRGYFKIKKGDEEYLPPSFKDSALLEIRGDTLKLLTRPTIDGLEINWFGVAEGYAIDADSLKPVMTFEDFETKVGWSTNAVRISSNEYLVGWHGVGRDMIYRNGLAVVSPDGDLLGITDYLLEPKGIAEEYGDRPGVVFGCGLLLDGKYLYWIGGISDYAIGIFRAELDKALETIKWVKRAL
nr:MAG: hypothetical protein TU35_03720 [Thermoproteus sp. AZ2]